MRTPVAFIGFSKSGKTTLLVSLVRLLAGEGERVAVIKHTHHEPARCKARGDTERFLEAGAVTVVLAGQSDAVIQRPDGTAEPRRFQSAAEIPGWLEADRILVEGFKSLDLWPRILVEREQGETIRPLRGVSAVVTDSSEGFDLPRFRHDDLLGIRDFLDRISPT